MAELDGWENFYVIIGSSAGALIGLQFVVMTLIAEMPAARGNSEAGDAFGTPNVVHFAVALLTSALIVAPWRGIGCVAVLWGLVGGGGMAYAAVTAWRMRSQKIYRAVFEDWLCHAVLPFAAYAAFTGSACVASAHARASLFILGGATLLLLFIGIHNAWDTVTYHVYRRRKPKSTKP